MSASFLATLLTAAVLTPVVLCRPASADSVTAILDIPERHALWVKMTPPVRGDVELRPWVAEDCANGVLRLNHEAMLSAEFKPAMIRSARMALDVGKAALKALGLGAAADAADVTIMFYESPSQDAFLEKLAGWLGKKLVGRAREQVLDEDQRLRGDALRAGRDLYRALSEAKRRPRFADNTWNGGSVKGQVRIRYQFGADAQGPFLSYGAVGNCNCRWPTNVPRPMQFGRWVVSAKAYLEPVRQGNDRVVLRATNDPVQIRVNADCGCTGRF